MWGLEICYMAQQKTIIISAFCFYNNLILSMFHYLYWKQDSNTKNKYLLLQDSWITMFITILFFVPKQHFLYFVVSKIK